jgi:phosphatidylglycerophosphatase A
MRRWTDTLWLAVARMGPLGLSPVMPGTVGSAAAALAAPWLFLPLPLGARLAVLAAVFVIGAVAAGHAERILGKKDPGQVNIDELVGQWLTFLPLAHAGAGAILLGFFLFRFFDILKPWPIRRSEHWLPGGWGVMLDDVLAGVYAAACLYLITARAVA